MHKSPIDDRSYAVPAGLSIKTSIECIFCHAELRAFVHALPPAWPLHCMAARVYMVAFSSTATPRPRPLQLQLQWRIIQVTSIMGQQLMLAAFSLALLQCCMELTAPSTCVQVMLSRHFLRLHFHQSTPTFIVMRSSQRLPQQPLPPPWLLVVSVLACRFQLPASPARKDWHLRVFCPHQQPQLLHPAQSPPWISLA